MNIIKPLFSLFLLLAVTFVTAQNTKLANNYMRSGEYGKAAELYAEIYEKNPNKEYYLGKWVEALQSDNQLENAEKTLNREIKKLKNTSELYVLLGTIYRDQNKVDKEEESYAMALQSLNSNVSNINRTANRFKKLGFNDKAAEVYLKGRKLTGKPDIFALEMADTYRKADKLMPMIQEYLNYAESKPDKLKSVQNLMKSYLSGSQYDSLKIALYDRLQQSDDVQLTELLAWTFVQSEDYNQALRQYKALDRRLQENGQRVYNIANTALRAEEYEVAIDGYEYLVDKGKDGTTLYLDAQESLLLAKRRKILRTVDASQESLRDLQQEYKDFLDVYGWNSNSASIIMELAELEALHLNDLPTAIGYLKDLVQYQSLEENKKARAKIDLADYYLMDGEIWESTLLYSQVDKDLREQVLGQEARFKNAKLSYYNGNFEWAQEQFNVLKSSTSRMIANDAIDLSVFITDNFGLDTTRVPMEMYAKSDLLILQNRFDEAIGVLDSIQELYPDHKLEDDILYNRGQIYYKLKEYDLAIRQYEKIVESYPDEIRADNALFNLGYIYEVVLNDQAKAMEAYSKIFMEYTDSTFAVEARKKFRRLRGDEL